LLHLSLNILITLSESKGLMQGARDLFENALAPLVQALEHPETIDFEEDLIIIVTNVMRCCKSVSQLSIDVVR
jgi:hypothetical protein